MKSPTLPLSIAVIVLTFAVTYCGIYFYYQNRMNRIREIWSDVNKPSDRPNLKMDAALLREVNADFDTSLSNTLAKLDLLDARTKLMCDAMSFASRYIFEPSTNWQRGFLVSSYLANCRTNPLYLSNPELAAAHRQRILEAGNTNVLKPSGAIKFHTNGHKEMLEQLESVLGHPPGTNWEAELRGKDQAWWTSNAMRIGRMRHEIYQESVRRRDAGE